MFGVQVLYINGQTIPYYSILPYAIINNNILITIFTYFIFIEMSAAKCLEILVEESLKLKLEDIYSGIETTFILQMQLFVLLCHLFRCYWQCI